MDNPAAGMDASTDGVFDPPQSFAVPEQQPQQQQQPESVMMQEGPRSLDELMENVNDQLEAELESIEMIFTAFLNEMKTIASIPPTTERSPPASEIDELRVLQAEVDSVCKIGDGV